MKLLLKLLSYPKSVFATLFVVIWTFLWSSVSIIGHFFIRDQKMGNFVVRYWSKGILWVFQVKVRVTGLENFSKSSSIVLFNHCSFFDIPILFGAVDSVTLRFGAKAELFKIPIFGGAMKAMGILEIHRDKREKVLSLYRESLKNLAVGYNYVLAPEGSRQDGQKIGRFKSGPFIMAIAGQCDLTPVVIYGTHKLLTKNSILPSWGIWESTVAVTILPRVPTQGLGEEQREDLQTRVYEMMSREYAKHSPLS